MTSRFASLIVCGLLSSSAVFVQAAPAPKNKLRINGKVASTRVKTVGGVAMVPLADVARALGQSLTSTTDGWEIKTASGTYQAGKRVGKIGDVFQTPKFSFTVFGLRTADNYVSQFLKNPRTFQPQAPTETLVIINCRIKNTLPRAQGPMLSNTYPGNTALTDNAGISYPPIVFDSRLYGDYSGASMLPGSQNEFALLFSVPKSAQIKDLVFSVMDSTDVKTKGVDIRVSLK